MRKIILSAIFFISFSFFTFAQHAQSAYGFLNLPTSSHANALGGTNISLVWDDLSVTTQNPALLGPEMHNQLYLSYMNYISDINCGGVQYARALNNSGAISFGAYYVDYGAFNQTTADNQVVGSFSVKDIMINTAIGYNISDYIRGGVNAKFIYSAYEIYTSCALAVDLGLNYYNPINDLSVSFVARNLGGQLKPFDEVRESLPFDLQFGISQRLAHAPFRYHITMVNLTDWNPKYIDLAESEESETGSKNDNFGKQFLRHLVLGVDWVPSDNVYLGLGYSYKRRTEFSGGGGGFFSGFSGGVGVKIKMFDINASIAQLHKSGTSFMIGINMQL